MKNRQERITARYKQPYMHTLQKLNIVTPQHSLRHQTEIDGRKRDLSVVHEDKTHDRRRNRSHSQSPSLSHHPQKCHKPPHWKTKNQRRHRPHVLDIPVSPHTPQNQTKPIERTSRSTPSWPPHPQQIKRERKKPHQTPSIQEEKKKHPTPPQSITTPYPHHPLQHPSTPSPPSPPPPPPAPPSKSPSPHDSSATTTKG